MPAIKYIARFEDQVVGKRSSQRTYTHAIVVQGHGKGPSVATWCGRPDLARGEQAKWSRYGYTATIVPAEIAPSKARG